MYVQIMEGTPSRITAVWSMQSESGQAAFIIIGLCAKFYYECLAFGRDIGASSEILQGGLVHGMVETQKSKECRKAKVLPSKLPAKLKSMQPKGREAAPSRCEELENSKRWRHQEE